MIHFKNHKPGFSFIEIMIAIVLFAIFGTSLFKIQTSIFSNTAKAHNQSIKILESLKILPEFDLKLFNNARQEKSNQYISVQKQITQPIISLSIQTKSIPEQSTLFKDFHKFVQIIDQTTIYEKKETKIISFITNIPKDESKDKDKKNE